ncbi:MAG TPA: methyltransferase domain-containing protein [Spirochaetota bacterium]|nr:methyltransferase domain-containing protein [Spirochaetota bacterium]
MHLDKTKVKNNFNRAAATYDSYTSLQQEIGRNLLGNLPADLKPRRILDIGCGTGWLTAKLADTYPDAEITAMDLADAMIRQARQQHKRANITYITGDVELNWPYSRYDLILSNATMQWINDLKKLYDNIIQSITPGGLFAFSVFLNNTFSRLKKLFQQYGQLIISHQLPAGEDIKLLLKTNDFQILYSNDKIRDISYKGLIDFMKKQRLSGTLNAAVTGNKADFSMIKKILGDNYIKNKPFSVAYHYNEYILRKLP